MTQVPEAFGHMLAAWNERDPDAIRAHLDRALSDDVVFCDPNYLVEGKDAFEAMVRAFRQQLPDGNCSRTSGVDAHHHLFRYNWAVKNGDELVTPGFDVAALNEDGKVCRVDGFFGPIPDAD